MKIFKIIAVALIAFTISACGSSYNEDKCAEIIEKAQDGKRLKEKDYNIALKQCDAILTHFEDAVEKIIKLAKKKDDKAVDLYEEIDEEEEMGNNLWALYGILDNGKLKGDQKKEFKALEKRVKKFQKDAQKATQLVHKLDSNVGYDDSDDYDDYDY